MIVVKEIVKRGRWYNTSDLVAIHVTKDIDISATPVLLQVELEHKKVCHYLDKDSIFTAKMSKNLNLRIGHTINAIRFFKLHPKHFVTRYQP